MTKDTTIADAFRLGYFQAHAIGKELTDREIEGLHPEMDCRQREAFANGMLDALSEDSWRIENQR